MINISRHKDVIDTSKIKTPIHIIGAGATGSRLFASLVELGFTDISIYDFDEVENHNLANQLFLYEDIGKLKVEALRDWARAKLGHELEGLNFIDAALPDSNYPLAGTVFLLTDTMTSRREIYDACLKDNFEVYRVIETRMASSYGNIYMFNPHVDGDKWLETLIDDDDAETSACGTSISVGSTASIIANMAVWQFKLALTDPVAAENKIDIFLKPFSMMGETWT